jgi:N-acetylglucosaminyldiphosphoundecaprenol N-acetyl-beta-D-mannosaminyltransferase
MESYDFPEFRDVMNGADLVTPDGIPLVWALRLMGIPQAERVYGPDLMPAILERAEWENVPVGFYGAAEEVLSEIRKRATEWFPGLNIVYSYAPPFRTLTQQEDQRVVENIKASGARILFVGLSTPKQDIWMARHRGQINAAMIGVGAAFDFFAGAKRQAPRWMMGAGLEWVFRLSTEPSRLWRRYLRHNPRFLALFARQLISGRTFSARIERTKIL